MRAAKNSTRRPHALPNADNSFARARSPGRAPPSRADSTTRRALLDALWHGRDPFAAPPEDLRPRDLQGWRSVHPDRDEAVTEFRPNVVVEIGAWKGASTLHLAWTMTAHDVDGTVIAVDTWLGAVDRWADAGLFAELATAHGHPSLRAA